MQTESLLNCLGKKLKFNSFNNSVSKRLNGWILTIPYGVVTISANANALFHSFFTEDLIELYKVSN